MQQTKVVFSGHYTRDLSLLKADAYELKNSLVYCSNPLTCEYESDCAIPTAPHGHIRRSACRLSNSYENIIVSYWD